jgi:hypothetical protein
MRIHSDTASSARLTRNGTRQPQSFHTASLIRLLQVSTTIRLSTKPPTTLAWI